MQKCRSLFILLLREFRLLRSVDAHLHLGHLELEPLVFGPVAFVHVPLHVVFRVENLVTEPARVFAGHVLGLDVAAKVSARGAVVSAGLAPVSALRVPRYVVLDGDEPGLNRKEP